VRLTSFTTGSLERPGTCFPRVSIFFFSSKIHLISSHLFVVILSSYRFVWTLLSDIICRSSYITLAGGVSCFFFLRTLFWLCDFGLFLDFPFRKEGSEVHIFSSTFSKSAFVKYFKGDQTFSWKHCRKSKGRGRVPTNVESWSPARILLWR
jgi:hypothetical protein